MRNMPMFPRSNPRRSLHSTLFRLLPALALATLSGLGLAHAQRATSTQPAYMPGELLVGAKPGQENTQFVQKLAAIGKSVSHNATLHFYHLKLNKGVSVPDAIRYLKQRHLGRYAEPNYLGQFCATKPNDYFYNYYQYAPKLIQADKAWNIWQPSQQVTLAVLDTGIDPFHPDLKNKLAHITVNTPNKQGSFLFGANVMNDTLAADTKQIVDPELNPDADATLRYPRFLDNSTSGHGTAVAGVAAAQVNNGIGIAGIAGWDGNVARSDTNWVKILPIKLSDKDTAPTLVQIVAGITFASDYANGQVDFPGAPLATAKHRVVINLSASVAGATCPQSLLDAVNAAYANKCVIVAAAGNNSSNTKVWPAACDHVISVGSSGATNGRTGLPDYNTLSPTSNYGDWVKVLAPGYKIITTSLSYDPAKIPANDNTLNPLPAFEVGRYYYIPRVPANNFMANDEGIDTGAGALDILSGTSIAAAHVSGEAALIVAQNPNLTVDQVTNAILNNVDPYTHLRGGAFPTYTDIAIAPNAGRVNVYRALLAAGLPNATKPTVPNGVSAIGSHQTVTLTWSPSASWPPVPGATYNVYSATTSGGPYALIASTVATTTYTDTGLSDGVTYYYVVSAVNGAGESAKSREVNATPQVSIQSITLDSNSVLGGQPVTATLTLDGPAGAGGTTVKITSSSPATKYPATVVVPENANSVDFTIDTVAVSYQSKAKLTATAGATQRTATLSVNPPGLNDILTDSSAILGGDSMTGTVELNTPAPPSGLIVTLRSSSLGAASVPLGVKVAPGATSATFTISTHVVQSSTDVTLTGTANGVTASVLFTVTPRPESVGQQITASEDSYVRAGSFASTNFGSAKVLGVKRSNSDTLSLYNRVTYLKFDLTGVTSAPKKAELQLTVDSSSAPSSATATVNVYQVTDTSWTEGGITWNTAPSLDRKAFASTGTKIGSLSVPLSVGVVTLDLTTFVKNNLGKVVTLQLLDDTKDNLSIYFASKEAGSGAPVISLTFEGP